MSLRAIFAKSRFSCFRTCKKHQQNMLLFHFRRDHGTFTFCHPSRDISRFLHFPDPGFQKSQIPLEGWQKVRVPENRKSAKREGEFGVLPRPGPRIPYYNSENSLCWGKGARGGFPFHLLFLRLPLYLVTRRSTHPDIHLYGAEYMKWKHKDT